MRIFMVVAVVLGLILGVAWLGEATVARIETSAPLQGDGEQSLKAALKEAVDTAVKGAVAMGLPWVHLNRAVVIGDAVAVQILATDTAPEGETDQAPGEEAEPGADSDPPEETIL